MNQLSLFQFYDKYSRWNNDAGRRETWEESVTRAADFLRELSQNKLPESDYERIYNAMYDAEAFCSMRLFAMAGEAARRQNLAIFNCSYSPINSIDSFVEILNISMAGCGAGFSVESRYTNLLPEVKEQTGHVFSYVIPDTTEGWCEALRLGLTHWFHGLDIEFDYSQIRPAGSILKVKGGRASGPQPLQELLDFARKQILSAQGRQLTPLEVHDIVTMIGGAAVSGGSRRSAQISLFDLEDDEMMHSKDYGWWKEKPQRSNANNSVVIEGELTYEEIHERMMVMHESGGGEPGIFSRYAANLHKPERREEAEFGTNPCQPGFAKLKTPDGIVTFNEVDVGDTIWSVDGWTKIVNKWQTGVKAVFSYGFLGFFSKYGGPVFVGTKDHRVITKDGRKVEIDTCYQKQEGVRLLGYDEYSAIPSSRVYLGVYPVYKITVDNSSHTYWSGGVSTANCGEINLRPQELCNLSQAILRPGDTYESVKEKVEVATIIGCIQATATHYPGMRPEWKENSEEERLLGVDLTAQMDVPHLITPKNLEGWRDHAVATAKRYSRMLKIKMPAAVTCNKPSGNSSVLFDCSPGIHTRWAPYYIRRARVNANSPMRHVLETSGMTLYPENGQEYETANTLVAEFPARAPEGAITNGDRSAVEQCEWWLMNKKHWTEHNPSVTISYREEELPELIDWIYEHQEWITGMSFLPYDDHYYPLAPYEAITKEEYERRVAEMPKIDFSLLEVYEKEDHTTVAQELACFAGQCLI